MRFNSSVYETEDLGSLGQQKSVKITNWKQYSMKIVIKLKKCFQNYGELLKQNFKVFACSSLLFNKRKFGHHTSESKETLKDDFPCWKW